MARINNLASALGLEEDSVYDENAEPVSEAEAIEANGEVDQAQDDLDTAIDTTNNLVDDGTTVAAVAETVQDSIDSGEGVSEPTAEVIQETIENILRRNGLSRNSRMRSKLDYPSNEDFGNKRGRMNAARRLKASLESVWDSIVNGLKTLWEKIKNFFSDLFAKVGDFDDNYRKLFHNKKEEIDKKGNLGFQELTDAVQRMNKTVKLENFDLPVYFYSTNKVTDFREIENVVKKYSGDIKQVCDFLVQECEENDVERRRFSGRAPDEFDKGAVNNKDFAKNLNGSNLDNLLIQSVCKLNKDYIGVKNGAASRDNGLAVKDAGKCKEIKPLTGDDWDDYLAAFDTGYKLCNQGIAAYMERNSEGFLKRIWDTISNFFSGAKKAIEQGSEAAGGLRSNTAGSEDFDYKSEAEGFTDTMKMYQKLIGKTVGYYKEVVTSYYNVLVYLWANQGGKATTKARSR